MEPETPTTRPPRPRESRIAATVKALIRTRVTAGVITILPIVVTIWLVRMVFGWMRDASQWVVVAVLESRWFHHHVWKLGETEGAKVDLEKFLGDYPALDWGLAIFSVLLTIFFLYTVGIFAANIVGRRALALLDRIVERVPLVKTVYRGLKQILSSLSGDQTEHFQRVALVPFPHRGMRCVGFVTNIFKDSITGEELCSVFISTTPNPTTGYLQILKRNEITELDWSVEEAIRTIMSGGILKPDFVTIVSNEELAVHAPHILEAARAARTTKPNAEPENAPPTPE